MSEAAMIIGQIIGDGKPEIRSADAPGYPATHPGQFRRRQSWLLRLIAEGAGIQTVVLDNEGEFASLREAVDVLLVGASGELRPNPRTRRCWRAGCSSIRFPRSSLSTN
jgi:hypothetical protein